VVLDQLGELLEKGIIVVSGAGLTPVASLRARLLEVAVIEARSGTGSAADASPSAAEDSGEHPVRAARLVPLAQADSAVEDWEPTEELTELAVPVDRDAVMRLIVGVQGL